MSALVELLTARADDATVLWSVAAVLAFNAALWALSEYAPWVLAP